MRGQGTVCAAELRCLAVWTEKVIRYPTRPQVLNVREWNTAERHRASSILRRACLKDHRRLDLSSPDLRVIKKQKSHWACLGKSAVELDPESIKNWVLFEFALRRRKSARGKQASKREPWRTQCLGNDSCSLPEIGRVPAILHS